MTPEELNEVDRKLKEVVETAHGPVSWPEEVNDEELDEIDRKVQEVVEVTHGPIAVSYFKPSTDWNAAMFAAEKAGIWKKRYWDNLSDRAIETLVGVAAPSEHDSWRCTFVDASKGGVDSVSAETGPLAICNAILQLKQHQSG